MKNTSKKTARLTQLALLIALLAVLTFTPLGFLTIPPVAITFLHIPVIIGAILLGPADGAILGLAFGLMSMIRATFAPGSPIDMLFSPFTSDAPIQSFIMCVVPRVLLGVIAAYLYLFLSKRFKNNAVSIGISAFLATLLHSFMVLGLLAVFFEALPFITVFVTIGSINCILEMITAIILGIGVCIPLQKYRASGR